MTIATTAHRTFTAATQTASRRTLRTAVGLLGAAAALSLMAVAGAVMVAPKKSTTVHELPRVVVTGTVVRDAPPAVVQLPRVVVTGRVVRDTTAQVVQLPRVVVTGRTTPAHTLMAQAGRIAADGA